MNKEMVKVGSYSKNSFMSSLRDKHLAYVRDNGVGYYLKVENVIKKS